MASVRSWLPPYAVLNVGARSAIAQTVTLWAEDWFFNRGATLSHIWFTARPDFTLDEAQPARERAKAIRFEHPRRGWQRLIELALDAPALDGAILEADQAVLEVFGQQLLNDLAQRLVEALQLDVEASTAERDLWRDGAVTANIVDPQGSSIVNLWVAAASLVQSRLATLEATRPDMPLTTRTEALGWASLPLRARLGACELALSEALQMAAGDLIILDRPLSLGAELVTFDAHAPVAAGQLVELDGQAALVME